MKLVLVGDGDRHEFLKWARLVAPLVDLWVVSSRGFLPGFDDIAPPARRLALETGIGRGVSFSLLKSVPRVASWLAKAQPDWVQAEGPGEHGLLAMLSIKWKKIDARLSVHAADAECVDELGYAGLRGWFIDAVLCSSALTVTDSQAMAHHLREAAPKAQAEALPVLGIPSSLPAPISPAVKLPWRFLSNSPLEAMYQPDLVLEQFAVVAKKQAKARLVMGGEGSLLPTLKAKAADLGVTDRVRFVGLLEEASFTQELRTARWFMRTPSADSVSDSVLLAMSYGCIPVLGDVPAAREVVLDGDSGMLVSAGQLRSAEKFAQVAKRAPLVAAANREWLLKQGSQEKNLAKAIERMTQIHCKPAEQPSSARICSDRLKALGSVRQAA